MKHRVIGILFLLFWGLNVSAQQDSLRQILTNWRYKTIPVQTKSFVIDSFTIIESSVEILNPSTAEIIPNRFYTIQNQNLNWQKPPSIDSVAIRYRVLPYNLEVAQNRLDTAWIKLDGSGFSGYNYDPYDVQSQEKDVIDFQGLDYQGSFERGIAFGNNQSLVLNSAFNLQMAGNIGDEIEILAAISDQNIPLQPEGNTQQLQEFDRIFMQLKRRKSSLIAGDYELARPNSYFMNYFKKLQGATASTEINVLKNASWKNQASFAIARGKFARNLLPTQEGNQGPYRLFGANGERFVIILSGTEKVYLDGLLLVRGETNDYVIDYNRGEISFTNNRLITKDSRIIVEFEYSDQNFLRSLYAYNTELNHKNWGVRFNLYSEQDSKNSSIQQELSSEEKIALSLAGDDIQNAFATGIDTLIVDDTRVPYKLVDTIYQVNGIVFQDTVLVYSTDPDSAVYTARFSSVGQGNGNYIPLRSSANGRVYAWVAPDPLTGQPTGEFEPVVKLVAPEQLQMYTLGGHYNIGKNGKLDAEVALSNKDLNRFSDIDSEDNQGIAFQAGYQHLLDLNRQKKKDLTLSLKGRYEFKQEDFNALNPYRVAEFTRDWNFNNTVKRDEHLANVGFQLNKNKWGKLGYELGLFNRDSIYQGTMHRFIAGFDRNGYVLNFSGSFLDSESDTEASQFFRPKIDIYKTIEKWNNVKIGVYGEREKNSLKRLQVDSLDNKSFYYDLYRVYMEIPGSQKFNFNINYTQRYDFAPVGNDFINNTIANEVNLNGAWREKQKSILTWNLTYRDLQIKAANLTTQDPQSTYLGRVDHSLNIWKGMVRMNTGYEIGSGQEPQREFSYEQVNPGQGVYQWLDYNNDGIEQLNEFEIAAFQDSATYVRVALFNNEFIRTNKIAYNQSLRITPRRMIGEDATGFKKFVRRFSTQSTFKIQRKTQESQDILPWNPFQLNVADSSLVSVSSNIRNILFFNKTNVKFNAQIGAYDSRNRVILTTGYESRRRTENFFQTRWNITSSLNKQFKLTLGQRFNDSEAFSNRDYDIDFFEIEPRITYQFSKSLRSILSYRFNKLKNTIGTEGENATNNEIEFEGTYNQTSNTSLRLNFSFVKVNYKGATNTPVAFAILEGLQNGQNFLWNLTLDRRLAQNILLSIGYDGRKTGSNNVIHTGRVSVRATF